MKNFLITKYAPPQKNGLPCEVDSSPVIELFEHSLGEHLVILERRSVGSDCCLATEHLSYLGHIPI